MVIIATNAHVEKARCDTISGYSNKIVEIIKRNYQSVADDSILGEVHRAVKIELFDNPTRKNIISIRNICLKLKVTAIIVCKYPERIVDVVDYLILKEKPIN